MSVNYDRACRVVIGSGSGTVVDFSKFRVRFLIKQWTTQSLNAAEVRIYNLARETASLVAGQNTEFKQIRIDAGYLGLNGQSNVGMVYDGSIIKSQTGRETPVDTFADFFCRDGDRAYNWGIINKTFAAGAKQRDIVEEVLKVYKPFDVAEGLIKGLSDQPYKRPLVLFGMARDVMRWIAHGNEATWNIQAGKLNHIPNKDEGDGEAFVLNANTGLIGMPQETVNGIIVRSLINPRLKINGKVEIAEKSINRAPWLLNYDDSTTNQMLATLGTSDGVYRVIGLERRGDTRGQEWYDELVCIGAKTGAIPGGQTRNVNYTGN